MTRLQVSTLLKLQALLQFKTWALDQDAWVEPQL